MGAVFLASMLAALDQTIVGTALPKIVSQLQGFDIYAWVFAAYFLGATATVTVVGKFSDLLGRKSVVLASLGLFALGSLLCGAAQTMPQLVAFRALQGIGGGGISTSALAIIGDLFTPRERGKWQTVNSLAYATASAIGPAVGGVISDSLSWRWIFYVNMPIAIGAAVAMSYALPKLPRRAHPSIDWLGGGLTIVGILALMLALTWGGRQFPWLSGPVTGLMAVALCAGLAFVWLERRVKEPIVPPGLLCGRVVPLCCFGMFAMGLVWFGVILLAPLFLERVLGLSATRSGGDLTPAVVLSGAAAICAGMLITRLGRYKPIAIAGSLVTIGAVMWLLTLAVGVSELHVIAALIAAGVGIGLVIPAFIVALQNAVRIDQQGVSMGVMSLFRQMGATIGTTLLGVFVSGSATELSPTALAEGIHSGFIALLVASVLMLAMALLTRDDPLRGRPAEPMAIAILSEA